MRKIFKLLKWIGLSLAFQLALLTYVDRVFLVSKSEIVISEYRQEREETPPMGVLVPSDAQNISVSSDGCYMAYLDGNSICIVDVQKGKKVKTIHKTEGTIPFFHWLPDRNRVVFPVVTQIIEGQDVQVFTMDVATGVESSYPVIKNLSKESRADEILLSTFTNVLYVVIHTDGEGKTLYRFTILNELEYIQEMADCDIIRQANKIDKIVYQQHNGGIFLWEGMGKNARQIDEPLNCKLLGNDLQDEIYIGCLNGENKVYKLLACRMDATAKNEWKEVVLPELVEAERVKITPEGEIFILDPDKSKVFRLQDHKEYSFQGGFVEIRSDFLVSRWKNTVRLVPLK